MVPEGPTWDVGVDIPQFSPLTKSIEVDVAVVGAGIMGITAAYLLAKAGYRVAVLEKDRIGWGATGVTTGFLTQYIDTAMADLIPMFGPDKARAVLNSHASAIDAMEEIVRTEKIECEFQRCPNFVYANAEKEVKALWEEQAAGKQLGRDMKFQQDGRLGFPNAGYIELPNQAKFHIRKYLAAMVEVLRRQGVEIFEETELTDLRGGEPMTLTTAKGAVKATHVVLATYAPFGKRLFFKKASYDSYVMELSVPAGVLAEGLYEDTRDPYHYFRVDKMPGNDRVIIGGEDHRSDIPVDDEKSFAALQEYVRTVFSGIHYEIIRRWQGPILESIDGLAWIGELKQERVFVATGFSGNGLTYGVMAAQLIADLIQKRPNAWASVYDPKRWPTLRQLWHKGRDYTRAMLGGAIKNMFRRTPRGRANHSE